MASSGLIYNWFCALRTCNNSIIRRTFLPHHQAAGRYMIAYEATAKETRFKSFLTSNQKSILL